MTEEPKMDFNTLISAIRQVHKHLAERASRAVNISLTLRNWLIGAYIAEFKLNGEDRATYGEGLLAKLAATLKDKKVSSCGKRQLYYYLRFYQIYPEIVRSLPAQLKEVLISGMVLPDEKVRSVTALSEINTDSLLNSLSYTHIEQLVAIEDSLKRTFYEIECMRGNWSVRELKRQIGSLYFERSGLSLNKDKLAKITHDEAEQIPNALVIRDPYIFEFLGIKSKEVMSESDLEDALLDKLQDFLLELGHGFCFEARQKRILIGDTYGFVDLVFYHRILKCHVLIDLKIDRFSHENIGQLNTYVSWYRKNMMQEEDNNPIGILLCAKKDNALVEYALAGMDNNLFVSRYQLELPSKEEMKKFLEESISDSEENELLIQT